MHYQVNAHTIAPLRARHGCFDFLGGAPRDEIFSDIRKSPVCFRTLLNSKKKKSLPV